ncbi:MAG: alpha/beta fold hydrolase, partial [Pseudomonadota bacterium]
MPDGGIVSDLGGRERFETVSFKAPIDLRDMSGTPYEMTAQTARSPKSKWRVIGIPGTPSRPYMWTRFVRKAPEDLDVSAVNRAGYGGAWYGDHRRPPVLSLDDQIAALAPLIEGDDRPAIVVGVSYGGALSLKAAMEFPRHIKGAVSVAALITEPRAYVRALLPAGDWPIIKQALPCHLHNAIAEVGGRRDQVGAIFSQLKKYQQPVTILHGNLDTLVPQSDAK